MSLLPANIPAQPPLFGNAEANSLNALAASADNSIASTFSPSTDSP